MTLKEKFKELVDQAYTEYMNLHVSSYGGNWAELCDKRERYLKLEQVYNEMFPADNEIEE